jgi:UDP-glucose 4-epimerase
MARALIEDFGVQSVLCVCGPHETAPASLVEGVEFVCADLTRYRDVRNLLFDDRRPAIDTIVHTPLQRDPRASGRYAFEQCVESARLLLNVAEEQPQVERFVLRSHADVYRIESSEPSLILEDHALEFSPHAAQTVRNRAEADLVTCARIGSSRMRVSVLRCAEILAGDCGSRLYDYLCSRVCLRPLGYDPMLNVLSLPDATRAIGLALSANARGIFNIPGRNTLPLSELIHISGRLAVVLPGPMLTPLYEMRARVTAARFRYAIDRKRMHHTGILDGSKARRILGYTPMFSLSLETMFAAHDAI